MPVIGPESSKRALSARSAMLVGTLPQRPQWLAWIIHEFVSQNKPTLLLPELRSLFFEYSALGVRRLSTAFALFRQQIARPCSGQSE
jgi:hypothetical protein